jgi:hypothetical protein
VVHARGMVETFDQRRLSTRSWDDVWNAHAPDAVDKFVADDVVIEAGGQEIADKDSVKSLVKHFLDHVDNLRVDIIETFQDEVGTMGRGPRRLPA